MATVNLGGSTEEVIRDARLELGETFYLSVSPGSSPLSKFTSYVPIHPGWRYVNLGLSTYSYKKWEFWKSFQDLVYFLKIDLIKAELLWLQVSWVLFFSKNINKIRFNFAFVEPLLLNESS